MGSERGGRESKLDRCLKYILLSLPEAADGNRLLFAGRLPVCKRGESDDVKADFND
jgi:hypothetical protein